MRRKIKSLIIRYGIPAIWFTLNPNDITNPIKIKLAAYRNHETGEAEEFLRSLDQVYKRVRLAISDPLSSAIFFHREISMFFKHYVRIGEDSIFGRVSQYYGVVETNERGALHLHGLLWLQGNMHLGSLMSDVRKEDQAAYRDRVIEYIDTVFTEDLDAEASAAMRAGRSVSAEISSLLDNMAQFEASFEEEANFCAGATQTEEAESLQVRGALATGREDLLHGGRATEDSARPQPGESMEQGDGGGIATQPRHILYRDEIGGSGVEACVRWWPLLRRAAGGESLKEPIEETVLLGEDGQRVSLLQAYPHRGRLLEGLALYDYMSMVRLKRKGQGVAWGEIELDSYWPLSRSWIQVLRRPGQHATLCFDGYLGMNFTEEDGSYHRRKRARLPKRVSWLVDNVQLLRRSAEDVAQDAKQWAALSGELEPVTDAAESGSAERDHAQSAAYQPGTVGTATRLIDIMRNAISAKEITAGSKEISAMVEQMYRFQAAALESGDDLYSAVFTEAISGAETPGQEQLRSIKAQQTSLSREREKAIQGMQSGSNGRGREDGSAAEGDCTWPSRDVEPSTGIRFGPSTSFCEVGRRVADSLTLNRRQSLALWLICRRLDQVRQDESGTAQLCLFVGGEGGTGKSRVIAAVAELFACTAQSHRLLVTATSGIVAANINGITIHSACKFSKDIRASRGGDPDGFTSSGSAALRVDGRTKMDWQEKYGLIIDEVSMLGVRTLYAVNEQLCRLRESSRDFGGIPVVLFCGDFHQFR
ncbi:ATP-dependent DNA helicase PIF1, partial [Fusarium albosuccineum]